MENPKKLKNSLVFEVTNFDILPILKRVVLFLTDTTTDTTTQTTTDTTTGELWIGHAHKDGQNKTMKTPALLRSKACVKVPS